MHCPCVPCSAHPWRPVAGKHFDFFRLLSFYCSGSGFYMTTMFTIWAVYFFAMAQVNLSLSGAEIFEYIMENEVQRGMFGIDLPEPSDSSDSSGSSADGGGHRQLLASTRPVRIATAARA